jgi:hypothetical protein
MLEPELVMVTASFLMEKEWDSAPPQAGVLSDSALESANSVTVTNLLPLLRLSNRMASESPVAYSQPEHSSWLRQGAGSTSLV